MRIEGMENIKTPWYKYYDGVAEHLDYPQGSMSDMLKKTSEERPAQTAYEFEGYKATYAYFYKEVETCAKALKALGVSEGDRVTICLPNVPQAVIMFYAINTMGAVANMVHPLSAENEIKLFIEMTHSKLAITLDRFYDKFVKIRDQVELDNVIVAKIQDKLKPIKRIAYNMFMTKNDKPLPDDGRHMLWEDFMKKGAAYNGEFKANKTANDCAAILYSGGTTGTMKGIELSNLNFNALALQTAAMGNCIIPGHLMLAVMPVFHGFGLGVCIHTAFVSGLRCLLVPQFSLKGYSKLLKKKQPNYIAGVPTIYEALLRSPTMDGVDLSCLEGVFSGGDSLSGELKKKVDEFLTAHGAKEQIREGYGTTECVTASCLTPKSYARPGSIGIPFPDTYYKIVEPSTDKELDYGTEGEIVLTGPSMMIGYLDNSEETALTLRKHSDGHTWLHTGDLGTMDTDGFIYFKQRLKRMIVTSGYSVYPSQLENTIEAHPDVLMSCCIGVPDPYKMQKIKAFIVLKPGVEPSDEVRESIKEHCRKNIAKYALPYEYEFREKLPQTLVGKIAYTVLEKEEKEKMAK